MKNRSEIAKGLIKKKIKIKKSASQYTNGGRIEFQANLSYKNKTLFWVEELGVY